MQMNILNRSVRTALCALALLVASPAIHAQRPHSTAADSPGWNSAVKDKVLDEMSRIIENQAYVPGVDFSKWPEGLAKIKAKAEKAPNEDVFAEIVNVGLRDEFKISHIYLLPPKAVDQRVTQKMVGIGIRINIVDDGVLVVGVIPGAPASQAGIEQGDLILEADGHKVDGPTYITGPIGTSVKLKVKKANGTVKVIAVKRAEFSTKQPEELEWIDKDTAAIRIHTFDLSYDRDNVEKLMADAAKAKNLIVDLRGNGGGAVLNMMHFLSTLMPEDTAIGTFINRGLVKRYADAHNGDVSDLKAIAASSPNKIEVRKGPLPPFKGRVAVVVNGGSGSASEITAEALKEILHAPVVGTKSAGAVLVSVMGGLPHGFNIQYPISDYISRDGVRLEANGIRPDLEVKDLPFVKTGDIDPSYAAAKTLLAKITGSGG